MSEVLQDIILAVVPALFTGSIGGLLYYKQNKKLKEYEVKAAELNNISTANGEWETFAKSVSEENKFLVEGIHNQVAEIQELNKKIEQLNESKEKAWEQYSDCRIECAKKDRLISELNWYRCEINGCPYRKPPRKYGDSDFPENAVVKTEKNKN